MDEIKRRNIGRRKHGLKNNIPGFCNFVFIRTIPFVVGLYDKIDKNDRITVKLSHRVIKVKRFTLFLVLGRHQ